MLDRELCCISARIRCAMDLSQLFERAIARPSCWLVVCTMLAGIVIYKVITFFLSEKPREPMDTEYVLNFVNILSLCYVSSFIFSA